MSDKKRLDKDVSDLLGDLQIELFTLSDGLNAIVSSSMDEPRFDSSTTEEANRALQWMQNHYGMIQALLREYDIKVDRLAHRLDDFTTGRFSLE